ncbi:hypothetical protein NDU88_002211 [Pleurodeles waltl]|uniref:Uncharacterized protein n=1 Tax=Pleurodeles waltl TaxID=8319 RepID=A0AAV7NDC4_PLEWA|nr:hypothetical protein NDU88_002211 [Pleurodeles waltl]
MHIITPFSAVDIPGSSTSPFYKGHQLLHLSMPCLARLKCKQVHKECESAPCLSSMYACYPALSSILVLEPFSVAGPPLTQAPGLKLWAEHLEPNFEAMDIADDTKRVLLLHLGRADVHNISKSVFEAGPPRKYMMLTNVITVYFESYTNPEYERFLLQKAWQWPDESVDVFHGHLE